MGDFVPAFSFAAAVYLGLLLGTRVVMRRLLHRRMYARDNTASTQGAGAAHDAANPSVKEVPATRNLSIEVINSAWSSDDGQAHMRLMQEARGWLRQVCLLDAVVVLTFVFLMTRPDTGEAVWAYLVVAPFLLVVPLRYLFHRRQYWVGGADPWKTRLFGRLGTPPQLSIPLWALHKATSPALQLPLRWGLLAALVVFAVMRIHAGLSWGWASLSVALLVAAADLALWRKLRQQRGPKLLVLRVFHKDEDGARSAVATFGGVLGSWLNFGAFFTVMDDTLLRYRSPVFSARNVAVLLGIYYQLAFAHESAHGIGGADLTVAGAVILVAWLADAWLVRRNGLAMVVADAAEIPRIARQADAARGIDLQFRSVEVPCLNSTWYATVAAIAGQADVVLMDLRGYAPERTGCDVEVNLLFDAVALRRVVFMVEPGKLEEIAALFGRCWRELSTGSPNLQLLDPTVSVLEYPLDQETPKDLIAEKQILLEELLFRTTGLAEGRSERARRAKRWVIDPARPGSFGLPGPLADAQAMQPAPAAALMAARPKGASRPGLSGAARSAVRDALARFDGTHGLHVGDGIPKRKARNARKHARIPPEEQLLALVDLTLFRSGKQCWAFTDVALRHCYLGERYVVEYAHFPWRKFSAKGLKKVLVTAPDGTSMPLESLQGELSRSTALEILLAVQAAVSAQRAAVPAFGLPTAEPAHPTAELAAAEAAAVRAALAAAKGRKRVYSGDELTEEKVKNARAACFVPPEEELLAFVDTTVFKSATLGWAFTDRALRYTEYDHHVLEYKYFPTRTFARGRFGSVQIQANDGTSIALYSTGGPVEERIAMLESIKSAVRGEAPVAAVPDARARETVLAAPVRW